MYSVNENIVIRKIDSDFIVINLDSGEITTFDGSGNAFFEAFLNACDEHKMFEQLIQKFDVEESVLREDISEFLKTLLTRKIIDE